MKKEKKRHLMLRGKILSGVFVLFSGALLSNFVGSSMVWYFSIFIGLSLASIDIIDFLFNEI